MKSLLLLVVVVPDWSSGFARSPEHHGRLLHLLPLTLLLLLLLIPTTANRVGVRGGFGERQPGMEYDTEDPLFDFNVLITGVQKILCRFPLSLCARRHISGPFFRGDGLYIPHATS